MVQLQWRRGGGREGGAQGSNRLYGKQVKTSVYGGTQSVKSREQNKKKVILVHL